LCVAPLLVLLGAIALYQGAPLVQSCLSISLLVASVCLASYCGLLILRLIRGPHDRIYVLRLYVPGGRLDAYCSLNREYLVQVMNSIRSVVNSSKPQDTWALLPHG
jgi:hypothetical protein